MPDLCPLWGDTPVTTLDEIDENGVLFVYSPRAGGVYRLTGEWGRAAGSRTIRDLIEAPDREKANLSHWIYRQNLDAGLLRPPATTRESRHHVLEWGRDANRLAAAPCLDPETVAAQYARTPSALDRRLYLLNELLLQQDLPKPQDKHLQHRVYVDYSGFRAAAARLGKQIQKRKNSGSTWRRRDGCVPVQWNSAAGQQQFPLIARWTARMWVEEQLQARSSNEQVFVAMWFDECLKEEAYKEGFAKGIERAGYKAKRTDDDTLHSDKLDDRVMADIRQSRIVVADFTCETFIRKDGDKQEGLPNGNVHYEAGFAHGLGRPVIYTCRDTCKDYLRFDTRQINHIFWTDADDLARKLQDRLEGQFGRGTVQEIPDA